MAGLSFWQQGSNSPAHVPFDEVGNHASEASPRSWIFGLDVEREESQMARAREEAAFHAGEALAAMSSQAVRHPDADVLAAEERVGKAQGPAKRQGGTGGTGRSWLQMLQIQHKGRPGCRFPTSQSVSKPPAAIRIGPRPALLFPESRRFRVGRGQSTGPWISNKWRWVELAKDASYVC